MAALLNDIWPILLAAITSALLGSVGFIHNLKTRVAVLEKIIENLQKRVDSHSKKQDEVIEKMNVMQAQVLKQFGDMGAQISSLSAEVRNMIEMISNHAKL